ncbi:MAG: hypothetical protein Q9170_008159 [Blastenia crenularia]
MGSKSTCNANVSQDLDTASPFALKCEKDNTGYTMNWSSCRASVNAACSTLALATNPAYDKWIWPPAATAVNGKPVLGCSIAFWNPSNGALIPDYNRCRNDILGHMIDGCAGQNQEWYNVASVNLKRLPHRTETERDTGEAVDPGYPSEFDPLSGLWYFWWEGEEVGRKWERMLM